ncbi:hypothetical protein ceV_352 [Chrysochromulina ericina virus CeV-01B]|uniref:WLM domain-containing protein n=1 Tax=Chrysochromulina ericina virus CeV-01B TaxID=3070830 RepID=A0A0N9R3Q9_9VIRU|nr:hypothetical protein ceV_352 [Chrysochromulina ericina virus]ALH23258.1 hypothetical protein ceV_352 [Chrysochromulina ericina virus CeV-01B]
MKFNFDGLSIILLILIIIVSYRMYKNSDTFQLKCIVSDVDGRKYCVREREKVDAAADRLAEVNRKLVKLVNYCNKNNPDDERCIRLQKKFNPKKLVETLPTSEYTAYSENKGEKLAFCLDKKKNSTNNLIDINTLTYVAIHELAHICTISIGHTPEFWENFKFLLVQAKAAGLYNPVDYKNKPGEYCGMPITDNPYYDK